MIRAVPLYTFLDHCNSSPLEKEVLECGAGVSSSFEPLLVRFYEHGYKTHGIEISDERLAAAQRYGEENGMALDISKGDMREIPFEDESMSFIFSYNTIFHMTKADIAIAMREIERVLKPGGLCFVNFMSVDDDACGEGEPLGKGEFVQAEAGGKTVHVFHADDEPDVYFSNFDMLHKEKRILERWIEGEKYSQAYIDYIAQKRAEPHHIA
jgi:ubiquinone/menaquinone biosynthesis C-methylase UbiE